MLSDVHVGLIDSGIGEAFAASVVAIRRPPGAAADRLGHGSQIARCVLEHCPSARLSIAQVFDRSREASVDAVLDALQWLAGQGVQLINMSFGMAAASPRLARACRDAALAGIVLVAAAPARGGAAFPAALDECIAVTGDARCAPGEVSWLATPAADFGTHPLVEPGRPEHGGGASIATARLSGLLAAMLAAGVAPEDLRAQLQRHARHVGPERRHA
jgi:hypothetical protein